MLVSYTSTSRFIGCNLEDENSIFESSIYPCYDPRRYLVNNYWKKDIQADLTNQNIWKNVKDSWYGKWNIFVEF